MQGLKVFSDIENEAGVVKWLKAGQRVTLPSNPNLLNSL